MKAIHGNIVLSSKKKWGREEKKKGKFQELLDW